MNGLSKALLYPLVLIFDRDVNMFQAISLLIIAILTCLVLVSSLIDSPVLSCFVGEKSIPDPSVSSSSCSHPHLSASTHFMSSQTCRSGILPTPSSANITRRRSSFLSLNWIKILVQCFSVQRNIAKLFSLKTLSDEKLQFVHGTRVLTMLWIIVCHTYTYGTQFIPEIASKF